MREKITKVYPLNELTEDARQKAIDGLADINVSYEWWDCTYEDAANVGIKLTEFDIGRGNYCHGAIDDTVRTAEKILQEHGVSCESYKTAKAYLASSENGDIDNEFRLSILEDYRIMLQKEYEYQTSEEAIVETIEANEYEFTEDGRIA